MSAMKSLGLLVVLAFGLFSCQYSPYADKYTTVKPALEDFTGVYEFDFQTVIPDPDLKKFGNSQSQIIINPDSTYEVRSVPVFEEIGVLKYKQSKAITRTGKWRLQTVGVVADGNGKVEDHWGLFLDSNPGELRYAGFMGKKAVNGIIFGYGDPDNGTVMTFAKK